MIAKDYPGTGGSVPEDVYSTAFFAHSTRLIAKIAAVLGKDEDERYYTALSDSIKQAFNSKFVNPENGMVKGNTQAGYALALKFHLLPDSVRALAVKNMIDNIHSYDDRMSTGFQSSVRMMDVLVNNGYAGLAYRLLESQRMPSWLYSVDQGATTIWERWDGYVKGRGFQSPGMNSFNHYAFGSVSQWIYEHILGIQPDEKQPGYHHFIIHPVPGGDLKWATGSYHSINGMIVSDWKRKNNHFTLQIEIPVNTTATVYVPMWGNRHREQMEGIKFLRYNNDEAIYLVLPGKYTLKNF